MNRAEQATRAPERLTTSIPTRCTVEQVTRARIAVAQAAVDADDCARLLEALGIGREVQV